MPEDKMSIKEAAEALGVSRNTVFNMADRGLLRIIERPYGKPKFFVPTEDVTALLREAERSEPAAKRKKK